MFDNFESFTIKTQMDPKVSIYGIQSPSTGRPSRPALLLLHGFPQTHHTWHRVAPLLSSYRLIMPDLRGYGSSSKPAHDVSQYAKSVMARDLIVVMDALLGSAGEFFVCAHDRGARVAHKLLVDYPTRVRRAILLDICPTLAMYTVRDPEFAKVYFHWYMLIQPAPLPETLLSGNPRKLARLLLENEKRNPSGESLFDGEAMEHYVRGFEDADTVHGWCQDYRASATLDLDEAREDLAGGRLVRSPVRVLLGERGIVDRVFDGSKEWRDVTEEGVEVDVRSVDSGHFIPEEMPEELVSHILEFLR